MMSFLQVGPQMATEALWDTALYPVRVIIMKRRLLSVVASKVRRSKSKRSDGQILFKIWNKDKQGSKNCGLIFVLFG